jgi:hypothetical protein
MAGRVRISEMTDVLAGTYSAIDMRIAAVQESDGWVDGLTTVRLTYESVAAAECRFQKLRSLYAPVATSNFNILQAVRPFSDWEALCKEFQSALLHVDGLEIRLRQRVNLMELAGEIRPNSSPLRPFDDIPWPAVSASVGASNPRMGEESFVREVGRLGYSFPLEAVNELCQVDVTQGQNPGQEFYISAPAFARIDEVSFHRFEKKLEVKARKHFNISGLSGTTVLREQYFGMGESSRYRKLLPNFEVVEKSSSLQVLHTCAHDLPEISLETWVEVKLVHSKLGEVQQIMERAQSLIPQAERNVLFEALKHFCPKAALEQLVVNPLSRKSVKLKTSAAFELHVAWLLGLCGLSTIVLGEYEHLVAPETNIHRGSVDILASRAHGDTLILVACTLGPLKEEDFGNVLNVRGILKREVFDETSINVLPVIFTGAHGQPPFRANENELIGIPVMDAERIENLLSLIRDGMEKKFFEFLGNPGLSTL